MSIFFFFCPSSFTFPQPFFYSFQPLLFSILLSSLPIILLSLFTFFPSLRFASNLMRLSHISVNCPLIHIHLLQLSSIFFTCSPSSPHLCLPSSQPCSSLFHLQHSLLFCLSSTLACSSAYHPYPSFLHLCPASPHPCPVSISSPPACLHMKLMSNHFAHNITSHNRSRHHLLAHLTRYYIQLYISI